MITVHHRKTYTLKLDIPSDDKLYPTIRDAYDRHHTEGCLLSGMGDLQCAFLLYCSMA